MPLTAALRSASKPASPVTYARRPSPVGGGTIERIVSTAASAVCVLSSVISAVASTRLLSGEISSARPGLRSSGSSWPQASPYGVPTSVSVGIGASGRSAAPASWIALAVRE